MSMILLAFPGARMSEKIRSVLIRAGYGDVRIVSGGGEALREMTESNNGILICPVRLRDTDYFALLEKIPEFHKILLVDTAQNIAGRREENVMALSLPLVARDLMSTIDLMLEELEYAWRREKKRRQSIPKKRSASEEKILEAAKHKLMEKNHMTEPEAFRYIQKSSMNSGRSMTETAEMILVLM